MAAKKLVPFTWQLLSSISKRPADNYLFALTERMGMWDCCFVFELLRITLTSQPHRNNQN